MNRRLAGVTATLGALTVAGALTAAAAVLPRHVPAPVPAAEKLPVTAARTTLVCPGPETLLVPQGGKAVDPGGPVVVRSLTGSASGSVTTHTAALTRSGPHLVRARSGPSAAAVTPTAGTVGSASSATAAPPAAPPAGAAPTSGVTPPASTSASPQSPELASSSTPPASTSASPQSPEPTSSATASGDNAGTGDPAGPTVAAGQSTLARSGDLRGLTATTCSAARRETWLVGGSTTSGARLRLLLANPADTAAVVDAEVLGPQGRIASPSAEGIVVPAHREVPVMVDALAPGLGQVAVHVTARSGQVVATMEESLLRGLAAGGVDDVPAAATPAKEQVVPGVSLVDGYGKGAGDPSAAGSTSVRVAVPGSQDAVVQIHLVNSRGTVQLPQTSSVTVPAGSVVDVPVSGLPSGTYTAVIESDTPVVAGARVGRALNGSGVADFGWAAAATRISGSGYAVLPAGASSTLSLAAPKTHGRLDVTVVHADGSLGPVTPVSVPAGSGASVDLPSDAVAVRVGGAAGGPVTGAVVATADDAKGTLISVLPLDIAEAGSLPTKAVRDGP